MGNHTVDCPVCGSDLRGLGGGHEFDCPGEDATQKKKEIYSKIVKEEEKLGDLKDRIRHLKNDLYKV